MRIVTIVILGCLLLLACAPAAQAPPPLSPTPAPLATPIPTVPTLTPAPTLPDLPADLTVVPEAGYAFRPPPGWQVRVADGIATLEPPGDPGQDTTVLVLSAGPLDELVIEGVSASRIASLDELTAALLTSLEQETPALTIEARDDLTLDELPAQLVQARSPGFADQEARPMRVQFVAALPAADRAFLLLALAAPPDAWAGDALFADLAASVRLFAPVGP